MVLTTRQARELHKSVIAYLASIDKSSIQLREELSIDSSFDDVTQKKYEGILERKWTGVMRLQRRILDLESRVSSLEARLASSPIIKLHQDSTDWLPDTQAAHTLQSHRQAVTALAIHPVYSSLASASEDCTIKIWDWEHGALEQTLKGHLLPVLGLDFGGPEGQTRLASCSSDLTIKIWDPSHKYANLRTLCGHDHSISVVRFSPNGYLVSAGRDASIRIWDVLTGYCLRTIDTQGEWIRDISLSLDGSWVVSAGNDCAAIVRTLPSGESTARLSGHASHIECCEIAPEASHIYLAAIGSLRLAGGESFIATGSRDSKIRLWSDRGALIKTLEGHDTWVRGLAFHPKGKYLVSVGDDKTIRCWDLSQDARLVKTITGSSKFLTCIRWGPSILSDQGTSHMVAIGSADSTVRVWM